MTHHASIRLCAGLTLSLLALAAQAAQITFYEAEGFRGRVFSTNRNVNNFERQGFNDRASSVVVDSGTWEACEDSNFGGRCVVLREGSYNSLQGMNLNNRLSSVRQMRGRERYDNEVQAPMAEPDYAYRRRPNERLYEANISSARAVYGPPEQRCWMDREEVGDAGRGNRNVGGALAGALIGGVLGHQVGGGSGRDLATAGGAVAGAVIGSNVGRDTGYAGSSSERQIRRCEEQGRGNPQYWDVVYQFRGVEHRLQMDVAPGDTITVNARGEPRP